MVGPAGPFPRVGAAMVDSNYPILAPSFFLSLLLRRLHRPRLDILLHSVDCKTGVLPFFYLAVKSGVASRASLTVLDAPDEIEIAMRSRFTKRLIVRMSGMFQVYGQSQKNAFARHGVEVHVATEICTIAPLSPPARPNKRQENRYRRHGSHLVIVRGNHLYGLLRRIGAQACKNCTFLVHPPAELVNEPLPENMKIAPRNLSSSEYVQLLQNQISHIYLYDPQVFNLPSGRLLDSLQLGIPCSVPKGSELANQIVKFGGGYVFDDSEDGVFQALNHPDMRPRQLQVPDLSTYVKDQLTQSENMSRSGGKSILPWLSVFVLIRYTQWFFSRAYSRLKTVLRSP